MKKIISFALLLTLLCMALSVASFGADEPDRLVDDADLLTKSEEKKLEARLDEISEKHGVDVVVVTVESTGRYTPSAYSDKIYDREGYGQGEDKNGVMLLISMEERDWDILANGLCNYAIDSDVRESIGDNIVSDLSDGEYASAFNTFADECDYYIDGYINGFPFDAGTTFVISLVIGLVVAFVATTTMKGKLKSVRANDTATEYVKQGSMNVTLARDIFLYRHISRTEKPDNDSSSKSSGSRGHSGGKF